MFSKHEYVYAVYREGNFSRAAEKLFISQPSLSAAIKNIEKKLGAKLFERSGSGVYLTEIGKEYIAATEQIMSVEKDFVCKVQDINGLSYGHITVGASNFLSSYVLPDIIKRFNTLHPAIEIGLVGSGSVSLCNMLKSDRVDIVIDSFEDIDDYEGCPLSKERVMLCVPGDREINRGLEDYRITPTDIYERRVDINEIPPVSAEHFKDERFILLKSGNDMYTRAKNIFDKSGINPKIAFTVDQLNISCALANSGMGLCFATDTFFKYRKAGENLYLYNVSDDLSARTLYVIWKKNKYQSMAMREFMKIAKEVIK